jgi:single-stranded-DNA-specific exonuclease
MTAGARAEEPGGAEREWRPPPLPPAPEDATRLARALDLPPLVAELLWRRGYSRVETAQSFLDAPIEALHDPFLLMDMDRAVDRASRALADNERIIVYGDYDVDGLCGTALLVHFFRKLGREVESYIPDRLEEGYGLNTEAILGLGAKGKGLLITVDSGISNPDEVEAARGVGLDVIITDHHQPPDPLPRACAVVNPHRPGCAYPDKSLCGTGIAFKFVSALRRALRDAGRPGPLPNLRRTLDLVALATVADVADTRGENRVLLRHGLRELAGSTRPGLRSLIRMAGTAPEPDGPDATLRYAQVAFQIAPRINAAGRLGKADLALELLLETDLARAAESASKLDRINAERQNIQEEVYQNARRRVPAGRSHGDGPIVLWETGWHPGVLGIVASKLAEEFHCPVILIALDGAFGKGSGRTAGALHLQQALADCADLLETFGGHQHAAGLTLRTERLEAFAERFSQIVRERTAPEDGVPALELDGRVELSDLTLETMRALERMAPFGPGNARPVYAAEGLRVVGGIRAVGREGRHLKIELHDPASGQSAEAIGFGMGSDDRLDFLNRPGELVDAAFEPEVNRWNGRESLQLVLKDLRRSAAS